MQTLSQDQKVRAAAVVTHAKSVGKLQVQAQVKGFQTGEVSASAVCAQLSIIYRVSQFPAQDLCQVYTTAYQTA